MENTERETKSSGVPVVGDALIVPAVSSSRISDDKAEALRSIAEDPLCAPLLSPSAAATNAAAHTSSTAGVHTPDSFS